MTNLEKLMTPAPVETSRAALAEQKALAQMVAALLVAIEIARGNCFPLTEVDLYYLLGDLRGGIG